MSSFILHPSSFPLYLPADRGVQLPELIDLVVQLAENSSLGVNFTTLAGVDFRNINATSADGLGSLIPGQVATSDLVFTSATARTDWTTSAPSLPRLAAICDPVPGRAAARDPRRPRRSGAS